VDVDRGAEVALEATDHQPVMQWQLTNSNTRDGLVHLQVGTLASGGWYVRHRGLGSRRFADKAAAWRAARGLMGQHQGQWEQVAPDSRPFLVLLRPDGSRVLYDNEDDECLYACWGDEKDLFWDRYEAAINAGRVLRTTETHALFEGFYHLIQYSDPLDGSQRFALATCREAGADYHVVDYPDRRMADREYEEFVLRNEDEDFPYKSSDVVSAVVDRRSRLPEDLTQLPSGEIIATDDLEEYNRLYGLPSRTEWPLSPGPAVPPGAVCGATAEPRTWGPAEVSVQDITPAAWEEEDAELRPNALALAVLPDGRQLLASGHDGAARVWNIGDGAEVSMISGHSEWVLSVALAALSDGKTVVATGGKDGLARVWSVRERQALQEIEAHRRPVNSVAWAFPPGDVPWLVTGSDDATVGIWDVDSGLPLRSFKVGEPGIHIVWSVAAAVLADGHVYVAAGVEDMNAGSVYVWDATTGTQLHKLALGPGNNSLGRIAPRVAMAVLPDRSFRVAAIAGPVVRVWDGQAGQEVRSLSVPQERTGGDVALAALPDLRVAVAATSGQQTLVCDTESGATLARLEHQARGYLPVIDLAARPDGGLLLAFGQADDHPARVARLDIRW
jgi:WD40 repeat protein